MQKSFDALKPKPITTPAFAYKKYQKSFLVCIEASNKATGAVLSQLDDKGRERPIHYASRVLPDTELTYSALERGALGVIFTLKKFRQYLISYKFNCMQIMKH